ncbi:hypothetical protein [Eudoraea chungangensis]|uniref:hypothetical protein n=1 Tax=Eudoraea chungangensis TaxID=1481905 RepID=UPI0023ED7743|nr:hypothetical protein [Eudoraea chungangensis]
MGKKKFTWNSDKIVGLSAMGISFITLIIFIYQTNLMSKQNSLSILPYLQIAVSDNGEENSYALSILNHGVGPAIIESVTIAYDGKKYNLKNYNDYFINFLKSENLGLDSLVSYSSSSTEKGMAIPPGSAYGILAVNNSRKEYQLFKSKLEEMLLGGMQYEIIYRSIQDERWFISNHSTGPIKLD